MIINSLSAENVLKYATLKLDDIPEQGLIAVIGDNESGKSSIGESICFALFGRTFSLDSDDLDKIIRWGETRCSIKLELTTPNGQRYQIARFLDEMGNHGASISRPGEEPMVRGVEQVAARLKDIIGFGYQEFIESFYLAQREITTPHPHSFAVKVMAGVDVLERVMKDCEGELERAEAKAGETLKQKADVEEQIEALDFDEGRLASLEAEQAREETALAEARQQIAELKGKAEAGERALDALQRGAESWLAVPVEASFEQRQQQVHELDRLVADLEPQLKEEEPTRAPQADLAAFVKESQARIEDFAALRQRATSYRGWLRRLLGEAGSADNEQAEPSLAARQVALHEHENRVMGSRRLARTLMFVFLLMSLLLWGLSGLLGLDPTNPQAQALADWLHGLGADTGSSSLHWLLAAASAMTLLFIVFLVRGIRLGTRIGELGRSRAQLLAEEEAARREATDLARLDRMPLPEAAEILTELRDEGIAERAADYCEGPGAALLDAQQQAASQTGFRRIVDALEAGVAQLQAGVRAQIERGNESVTEHSGEIAHLNEMMSRERERLRYHDQLTEIAASLADKIEGFRRRYRVRELAIDLLHRAVRYISQRFNTEVRNLSADSLPKLTNGRYEHLQIDENLKVKAFSNEKRDFMDLEEISSGTQRQIMLAVRLSLSQKLVNSVIQGPQTLFLDEPFVFFDESRTASALDTLPRVSGDFTQIWVTAQTFPEKSHFDLYVECDTRASRTPLIRRGAERPTGEQQDA